jgi:hypothetical protein
MAAEAEKKKSGRPPRAGTRVRIGRAGQGLESHIDYGPARRVPRTAVGGLIGLVGVILFFAGLTGDAWPRFLLMIAVAIALLVLSVWALIVSPLRPDAPQRWRPHRHIDPLDLSGWRRLARETGLRLKTKRGLPSIRGGQQGVAVRLTYHQIGGARTVCSGALVHPFQARLMVRPRRAEFHTPDDRPTGDSDFDREFRCECGEVDPVDRFLDPEIRERLREVGSEVVVVEGRTAEAVCEGFVGDGGRLRGLLELVAAVAVR